LVCLGILVACTHSLQPSSADNPENLCARLQWAQASANVWYSVAQTGVSNPINRGYTSNSALIRVRAGASEQVWLLGQGASPRWGQALRCSTQKLGLTVTDTLSARAHPESVLGLVAFEAARTWGWPAVQQAMRERCPTCTPALARASGDDSIMAEQIRIPKFSLKADGLSNAKVSSARLAGLDVFAVARAPDDWTSIVRETASGVWIAPGLVWGPGVAPDLREASLPSMMAALQWLQEQGAQQVVPEQGRLADAQVLAANLHYWQSMTIQLTQAIASGKTLDDALMQQSMTDAAWLNIQAQATAAQQTLNRERHILNMQRAWRELEDAYFNAIKAR
jgi:hypothetical protein